MVIKVTTLFRSTITEFISTKLRDYVQHTIDEMNNSNREKFNFLEIQKTVLTQEIMFEKVFNTSFN